MQITEIFVMNHWLNVDYSTGQALPEDEMEDADID